MAGAKNNDALNQIRSAKYSMKSKSPKSKVGGLTLLLRGKSQNRIDSRGQGQLVHSNQANQGLSESTPSQISLVRKIMNHHGALINGQLQQQHRNNKINSFIEVANSQKIVEARIAAARRFNSVGFQSLLTSS